MLSRKALIGAGWTVSSRLSGRAIDFVTILVLARVLTPEDFGLIALATTLISILDTILEAPLSQALTRLRVLERAHFDTAFTLGLLRGLAISVVVLVAAWPFAAVFHDPRLVGLVALLALGPVARSLYSPAMVVFVRELRLGRAFTADTCGKVVAAVSAITLSHLGVGYWAIAASSVISAVVPTVISYFLAPYRPRLTLAKFADFASFLGWFSCSQIVSAINYQIDRVMLGAFVSKADLGRYTMAGDLAVLPTQSFVGPAMQPLMAAFSSIIDDQARVRSAYLRASRFTMMLALPICVGMSLTADLLVSVLLGPQWSQTAVYLRWLALATALSAYVQPLYSLALALNKAKVMFKWNLIQLFVSSTLIAAGLYWFSLMGAVMARGAVSVIMFIVTLAVAKEVAGIRILNELGNLWRPTVACAVMAGVVLLLRTKVDLALSNAVLELGLVGAVGAATYAAALFICGFRFKL